MALPVKLELLAFNNPETSADRRGDPVDGRRGGVRRAHPVDRVCLLAGGVGSSGDYQAYLIGWSGRVDIDGNTYAFLHSGQANNASHYANPTVDKLLDEARGMTDLASARRCMHRCGHKLRQDLPITYLWTARNIVACRLS